MNVTFFQNVGVLIMRFTRTVTGFLCKKCIDESFVRTSLISFFFGWWGVVSFFVTLFTLPLNVVTWLRSLSLPAPDPAVRPTGQWVSAGMTPSPAFDEGAGYRNAAAHSPAVAPNAFADPFGQPPQVAPAKSNEGKGVDMLAIAAMVLGVIAVVATVLTCLLGIGMIAAPIDDKSVQSGIFCIVSSSLVCGLPGLLGLAAGGYRLWARQQAKAREAA
jgi:hypothetical protein